MSTEVERLSTGVVGTWRDLRPTPPVGLHPGRSAYTLMEVLVAMSLLVILGGGLVALLGRSLFIWRTSETRGRIVERATAILDAVAEDLRSTLTSPRGGDSRTRFLADEGSGGRRRLRFIRTTPTESSDAILREAGRFLLTHEPAVYDGVADYAEAAAGVLAAPGGAMEVLYMIDPRPGVRSLWRAVRSPPGGPGSLFVDRNVDERREDSRELHSRTPEGALEGKDAPRLREPGKQGGGRSQDEQPPAAPGAAAVGSEPFYLEDFASPIASGILYLGFRFWAPVTNTWRNVPALASPGPGEDSGPVEWWDSTRGILDFDGSPREYVWRRVPGSLDDPSDDIFPARIEVTVVIAEGDETPAPQLARAVSDRADVLPLTEAVLLPDDARDHFILVDDEWIAVSGAEGASLKVAEGGRGRRSTRPAQHVAGSRVELGVTFRRVVEVPGFRPEVSARSEGVRGGRG